MLDASRSPANGFIDFLYKAPHLSRTLGERGTMTPVITAGASTAFVIGTAGSEAEWPTKLP
jgi:hypothetical protein